MNESSFKQKIKRHLVEHGWDVQMIETSTGRGVPDMNVSHPLMGDIWIEVKYGDKKPDLRPEQRAWLIRAKAYGRTCFVVWSWPDSVLPFNVRRFIGLAEWDSASSNLHDHLFDLK